MLFYKFFNYVSFIEIFQEVLSTAVLEVQAVQEVQAQVNNSHHQVVYLSFHNQELKVQQTVSQQQQHQGKYILIKINFYFFFQLFEVSIMFVCFSD